MAYSQKTHPCLERAETCASPKRKALRLEAAIRANERRFLQVRGSTRSSGGRREEHSRAERKGSLWSFRTSRNKENERDLFE